MEMKHEVSELRPIVSELDKTKESLFDLFENGQNEEFWKAISAVFLPHITDETFFDKHAATIYKVFIAEFKEDYGNAVISKAIAECLEKIFWDKDLCGTVGNDVSELLFNALDLYKNNQDVFEVICRCTKQLFSNNASLSEKEGKNVIPQLLAYVKHFNNSPSTLSVICWFLGNLLFASNELRESYRDRVLSQIVPLLRGDTDGTLFSLASISLSRNPIGCEMYGGKIIAIIKKNIISFSQSKQTLNSVCACLANLFTNCPDLANEIESKYVVSLASALDVYKRDQLICKSITGCVANLFANNKYSIPKKGTELMPQLVDLLKYHEGNAATYGSICMCIANIILSRPEQIKQNAFAAPALLKYAQMKQKDDEIFIGVGKCIQSIVLNVDEMYQKVGDQFIRLLSKSITLYEKECNKLGEILGLIGPFINRKDEVSKLYGKDITGRLAQQLDRYKNETLIFGKIVSLLAVLLCCDKSIENEYGQNVVNTLRKIIPTVGGEECSVICQLFDILFIKDIQICKKNSASLFPVLVQSFKVHKNAARPCESICKAIDTVLSFDETLKATTVIDDLKDALKIRAANNKLVMSLSHCIATAEKRL